MPLAALENRKFSKHAIRFLAVENGISQFIDIGPGLPTRGNLHQPVRKYNQDARIAYVDNDPIVLAQGRAHIKGIPGVIFTAGDLRDPDGILGNLELWEIIDLSQPTALCMTLVLYFIRDGDDPYRIVARLCDVLCPGSYLVISHVTSENREPDAIGQVSDIYDKATAPLVIHTKSEIARFFSGIELITPGIVFLSQWRPAAEYYADGGTRWAYAGIGRKPSKTPAMAPAPGNRNQAVQAGGTP